MTFLTENHYLSIVVFVVLFLDTLLELQHHRTGSIDNLDVVLSGQLVSLRWLTMGTKQHLGIVQLAHLVVIDGDESHITQTIALHTIVYNITKAI